MNVQFARLFGTFLLASNIPVAAIQRHGFPTLPLGLQVEKVRSMVITSVRTKNVL